MARRKLSELGAAPAATHAPKERKGFIRYGEDVEEGFGQDPVSRFLKGVPAGVEGAGRKVRQTTVQPLFRALGAMGLPGFDEAVEGMQEGDKARPLGTAGKVGGGAADLAMLTAGPAKSILGMAASGVAQHQAQNYGRDGSIRPGEAVAEGVFSTALPGVGKLVAKGGKNLAPKVLENLTKRAMKGGDNPVDWDYALRNKLVPYFGGAKEISARTAPKIAARDELRDNLLDQSGAKVNIMESIKKTLKNLRRNVGSEGSERITAGQLSKAEPYADDALLTAKAQDRRAKAGFADNAPADLANEGVFAREYRDVLEDDLLTSMRPKDTEAMSKEIARASKRGGPQEIDLAIKANQAQEGRFGRYSANKATLGKLTPIDIAAQDMAKAPHKLGLMIDIGLGGAAAGAPLVGDNDIRKAGIPLAILAARRGATTPGGARMLYEAGRGGGRKSGRALLDLARSATFSHGNEE
jgi:hypothetical protein